MATAVSAAKTVVTRRDHLLETALRLFNTHGFHATGIDKVQAESGVSKTTMYKYFKSKDELIQAVLERRHQQFGEWITARINVLSEDKYAGLAEGKLLALFDTLDEWFHTETFCGCNFINASAEYTELMNPIHKIATDHKLSLADYISTLIPDLEHGDRDELAKEICLLVDGAIVCAHTVGIKDSAERAKRMSLLLLKELGLVSALNA